MPFTSFDPHTHGFMFSNGGFANVVLKSDPLNIDFTTYGRCGGMTYLALDYWILNLPIPETKQLPPDHSLLSDVIYQRLYHSIATNGHRNLDFMNMLDHPTWLRGKGAARVTREDEYPKIKQSIDSGEACAVGLCQATNIGELGNDHQVVCFGYEESGGRATLFFYDCNFPDAISTIEFGLAYDPADRAIPQTGYDRPWRGFFKEAHALWEPDYLVEGTLLRESNSDPIRVARAGATCWIDSPEEFDTLGLDWNQVRALPPGSFAQLEQYPAGKRRLVKDRDQDEIYVMCGGHPFHIPSPQIFDLMGFQWSDVAILPRGSAGRMRRAPRDGTLVKENSLSAVYRFKNGQKCHVASPQVFDRERLHWDNLHVVPDKSLDPFPDGPPIT